MDRANESAGRVAVVTGALAEIQTVKISEEDIANILAGNAKKLFKL